MTMVLKFFFKVVKTMVINYDFNFKFKTIIDKYDFDHLKKK